jgi:hypothetical protein
MTKPHLPTTEEISNAFGEVWSGSSEQAPVSFPDRVDLLAREDLDMVTIARELDSIFDRALAEAIAQGTIIMRGGQLFRTLASLDDEEFPTKTLN